MLLSGTLSEISTDDTWWGTWAGEDLFIVVLLGCAEAPGKRAPL
jgi:hypothetical protein